VHALVEPSPPHLLDDRSNDGVVSMDAVPRDKYQLASLNPADNRMREYGID
jgi:hypothetical protein